MDKVTKTIPYKKPATKRRTGSGRKRKTSTKRKAGSGKDVAELGLRHAVAAIAILALFILLARPADNGGETGAAVPGRAFRYAVDLSHNNPGRIVWDSLRVMTDSKGRTTKSVSKAEDIIPVSYVILKASEGVTLKDRKFAVYWQEADDAGYGRGAYHFFRSSKDPELQAKNYIKAVGRIKDKDLPPILDIETIHKGCSRKDLNAKALTWLKAVEAHYGRTPVVYSNEAFIRDVLSDDIRAHYPLWVAHYRDGRPERDGWALWQFTDKAVIYGIDGLVDLNVLSPDFTN